MNENLSGLSAREVEERRARGEGGTGAAKITKTKPQIVRENLCTLFNFSELFDCSTAVSGWGILQYALYRHYHFKYCDRDSAGV